jgi:phosphatidylglycerophosphate synthase
MENHNITNILSVIGNLIILGALFYVVFILGYSGWWFALFLLFHFRSEKD